MGKPEDAFARRAFRRSGRAVLTTPEGREIPGRGIISALRKETDQPAGKRHALGVLARPPYHFTGWLAETENLPGSVMTQAGRRYRVLDSRRLTLGDRVVAVRCLLEREEEGGESP